VQYFKLFSIYNSNIVFQNCITRLLNSASLNAVLQGYVTVTEADTTLRLSNYMLAMQIHEP